jgi:hypothetical protein
MKDLALATRTLEMVVGSHLDLAKTTDHHKEDHKVDSDLGHKVKIMFIFIICYCLCFLGTRNVSHFESIPRKYSLNTIHLHSSSLIY